MDSIYDQIGGEAAVRRLVERFYDLMGQDPAFRPLREMHSEDLTDSGRKLFTFLSGWLGGPNLYVQAHGHPRLRLRHLPFAVDEAARDQWMQCMTQAMADVGIPESLRDELHKAFYRTADFMRNQ